MSHCQGLSATVILIEREFVQVAVEENPACVRCSNGRGCGLGFKISDSKSGHKLMLQATDVRVGRDVKSARPGLEKTALAPGDRVKLLLPPQVLLGFIFLALLLPAFLMILLASIGHSLASSLSVPADLAALLGIVAGCFGGALLARLHYSKRSSSGLDRQALVLVPATATQMRTMESGVFP